MKTIPVLFSLLALILGGFFCSGCAHTYAVREFKPPARALTGTEGIYIIVPKDYSGEKGSGELAASTLATLFSRYAARARKSVELTTVEQHLANARKDGFEFAVEGKIIRWDEEATEWSGAGDKLEMSISLLRVENGEVVSTTQLSGKSKWLTFGGDRVEHLLEQIGGKWVDALYGRGEFGVGGKDKL
ncbi:MAG: DUF4823 domain-containing protein [Verrucomicrobia bacterium]|nr:DUF4823 domain-containing protein [Verrucomicrobiota bacterium]